MKCAFCDIPEIKAREIAGDELVWAFPTNIPIVSGHTLISPRRCVATYGELTDEERRALEDMRLSVTAALRKAFGAQGFNFAWNDGSSAGQTVPHFHLHVLPRKPGDTGVLKYEPRKFVYRSRERGITPEEELIEVAKMIREGLKSN